MKTCIIVAPGCEESEVLTIADILRRAQIRCDLLGLDALDIMGTHHVVIRTDALFDETDMSYDMVILPGGYGGRDAMMQSSALLNYLKKMTERYIAAICAAPEVLNAANLLEGKRFTCYPGVANRILAGINTQEAVVVDGRMITGKGPAYAYAFAYRLVEILGGDALAVKKRMSYFEAFKEEAS